MMRAGGPFAGVDKPSVSPCTVSACTLMHRYCFCRVHSNSVLPAMLGSCLVVSRNGLWRSGLRFCPVATCSKNSTP